MESVQQWDRHPGVRAAYTAIGNGAAVVETAVAVQQIAAPTFAEGARAAYVRERFVELGLEDVGVDAAGNVYARSPGVGRGRGVLVAAHLDTVFAAGTDLAVRREGGRIYGPGIGDNALGVAGLIHLGALLKTHQLRHRSDIWLVADTGEEGLGDLRGMRAAIDRLGPELAAVIALEGCDLGWVHHEAVGVRRYRISVRAPGGHAWGDFGAPSAIHVLVRLAAGIAALEAPVEPRSSFNIGTIQGGTTVNAIAEHATLLLDLRSASAADLQRLVTQVEQLVAAAQESEPGVVFQLEVVGDRPAGSIPRSHPLVRIASAACHLVGAEVHYAAGSTDANIPLSRGIPAVCVAVGDGSNAHRLDEYIEPARIPQGMRALLLTVLAASDGW